MLVVQYGLAYHARRVLAAAVHDGAAAGARDGSTTGDGIRVARDLISQSASSLMTSWNVSGAAPGDRVVITATGRVFSIVPFAPGWTIRATGSAPKEQFRPEGQSG